MQITKPAAGRNSGRHAYFNRVADDARRQLDGIEADLNRYNEQSKQCTDAGRPVPKEHADRIAGAERRRWELRERMSRALYNAGRR